MTTNKIPPQTNFTLNKNSNPKLMHLQKMDSYNYDCIRTLHSHADTIEIVLVETGSTTFTIDGNPLLVSEGDIAIFNSNIVHFENYSKENDVVCYSFSFKSISIDGLRDNALIPDQSYPIIHSGIHFKKMLNLTNTMFSMLVFPLSEQEKILNHLSLAFINTLLCVINDNSSTENPNNHKQKDNEICQEIISYINNNFSEDLSIQTLSNTMNISPYHLCHIFKNYSGFSPIQYMIQRRLGEAQTLLEKTDYSATKIGMMVGFSNPSHFNAAFTKKIGMPPLAFRKIYSKSLTDGTTFHDNSTLKSKD